MGRRIIVPETWAEIKSAWIKGSYPSMLELHRWAHNKFDPCPSLNTIIQKAKVEGDWVRGLATVEEQQRIEAFSQKLFEDRNMGHAKVVEHIVAGIEGGSKLIQCYITEAQKSSGGIITSDILKKIEEARKMQLPWIEQYKDLTGNIAPTKRVVEIDLEAKWGVAQDAACNEAYLRRFGKKAIIQDAEVVDQ